MSASFDPGSPNSLSLSGEGVVKITGFEDTFATFALQGTGEGFTFTILQASNTAVPNVPDNGSPVAFFGLALITGGIAQKAWKRIPPSPRYNRIAKRAETPL